MSIEKRETIEFKGSSTCVKCNETYTYILVRNSKGELEYISEELGRRVGDFWICPEC